MADYLSLSESAKRLGISEARLRKAISDGMISPVEEGDNPQFDAASVDKLEARIKGQPSTDDVVDLESMMEGSSLNLDDSFGPSVMEDSQIGAGEVDLDLHGSGIGNSNVLGAEETLSAAGLLDEEIAEFDLPEMSEEEDDSLNIDRIESYEDRELSINFDDLEMQESSETGGFGDLNQSDHGESDMTISLTDFDLKGLAKTSSKDETTDEFDEAYDKAMELTEEGSGGDDDALGLDLSLEGIEDEDDLTADLPSAQADDSGDEYELDLMDSVAGPSDVSIFTDEETGVQLDRGLGLKKDTPEPDHLGLADDLELSLDEESVSDIGMDDGISGISLADDEPSSEPGSEITLKGLDEADNDLPASPSSEDITLGEDEDDEFVLGGSGGGSDITLQPSQSGIGIGASESGVALAGLADSGISLEAEDDLSGSGVGNSLGSGVEGDFMLSSLDEEEEDDSGSEVIALDDGEDDFGPALPAEDGGFDESLPPALGPDDDDDPFATAPEPAFEEAPPAPSFSEAEYGGMPTSFAPSSSGAAAGTMPSRGPITVGQYQYGPTQSYKGVDVTLLFICFFLLIGCGLFMGDLLRYFAGIDGGPSFTGSLLEMFRI
ncbi:Hypothetical protein PBC10988_41270 [Planctomycetales bacterium 10988]|nr:Hypothetical protein PBC10988_41270 [Planctomycetales bacterium 10988]